MNRYLPAVLIGSFLGCTLSFLLSATLGSVIWLSANPSPGEMRQMFGEYTDLTNEELDQLTRMMVVGAVIDFGLKVGLIVVPAVLVGTGLGLIGGYLWVSWWNNRIKV